MPHYIWIVKAYSIRDGGWFRVNILGTFRSEEAAWTAAEQILYYTEVFKTIAF